MEKVTVTNVKDMRMERRAVGEAYAFERCDVVRGDGSHRCGVRVYSIPSGKANYPYHTHETHEEIFYVISGQGLLLTEDGERPISPGDVIACPPTPQGAHKISNPHDEPLVYIEFDAISFPEVTRYPLSGGTGLIFADRERNEFYMDGRRATYEEVSERG